MEKRVVPSFAIVDFYVYSEDRVVTDGKLITSRGPGSALEFALQVVGQIVGHKAADAVANGVLFKS